MKTKTKSQVVLYEMLIYTLLLVLYKYPLSQIYSYAGFVSHHYESYKLVVSFLFVVFFVIGGRLVNNKVYYFVYHTHLVMVTLPGFVLYVFAGTSLQPNLFYTIPLVFFILFDKLRLKFKMSALGVRLAKKRVFFSILVVTIAIIPFLYNVRSINFANLLFRAVYDTRLAFISSGSSFIGYLMSPLSRYIFPFIAIYAIKKRRKILLLYIVALTVLVYLTSGALKGLLFSFAFVIFFSFNESIEKKICVFCQCFVGGLVLQLIYWFLIRKELFTGYIRRALFVGPQLFDLYYTYFRDNYIYYQHTRLVSMLTGNDNYRGITLWFGENVIGKQDLNASVGTFVEGYISLGFLGVFFSSIVFFAFCLFYSSAKLDQAYIGLLYSATGLFRGAFLEPLFLTHGLVILILMIMYLIPRESTEQSLGKTNLAASSG